MPNPIRKTTVPKTRRGKAGELAAAVRRAKTIQIAVNGVLFQVSPELDAHVRRACEAAAAPLPDEMTTLQAAEFLDVSRPFVVKLVNQGKLPCRMVGTHRRIPTAALRAYRESMFQHAKGAADDMARAAQDMGLYNLEGPPPKGR
jgi:excisionase family DNA binding protein